MFSLFSLFGNYYYIIVPLQILAIIHSLKTDRKQWLYLLIFLPLIGVVIYFFMELLPEIRRGTFLANFQRYFLPNQKINEWKRKVRISDNVTNKLELSNAYAEQGKYTEAIELAAGCLKGLYADDPAIHLQLARQYFYNNQYQESIVHFDKIRNSNKSRLSVAEDDLLYARAQDGVGALEIAEEAYQKVIRQHYSLEARYYYGMFLKKQQKNAEARDQFQAVREEIRLLPRYLRRRYAQWSRRSLKELLMLKN